MKTSCRLCRKSLRKLAALVLALLLTAALAACAAGSDAGREIPVHFITPDGEFTLTAVAGESLPLPVPDGIDGYVFLGWKNEAGELVAGAEVDIGEESYFSAVYGVALNTRTHPVYLFPDTWGNYRPYVTMTRAEAAEMLFALLAVQIKGDGSFSDVYKDAPYAEAAAALRELGIVSDARFRPNAPLTKGALIDMLSHFAPAASQPAQFSDLDADDPYYAAAAVAAERGWIPSGPELAFDADRRLTRLEAATLMNTVLGRKVDPERLQAFCPTWLADMPEEEDALAQMLEACIRHDFLTADGTESWTDDDLPEPVFDNGFTTGDYAFDRELKAVIDEVTSPELDYDENLHNLYRYVRDTCHYLKRPLRSLADVDSWLYPEAKHMLTEKQGNCYSYSALLCTLFRAYGLSGARECCGTFCDDPHAWVEAEIDGIPYIYDVEMEWATMYRRDSKYPYTDMYQKTYEEMAHWHYALEALPEE